MSTTSTTTEMTVPEIIQELTPYTGHFPKRAVQCAMTQRGAAVEAFLVLAHTGQMSHDSN